MQKHLKIVLIAIIGLFFSIATLEIDTFGYDNTFFDAYDSYVHVDNEVLHHDSKLDQSYFAYLEVIQLPATPSIILTAKQKGYFLCPRVHRRQLYLTQSSLLI